MRAPLLATLLLLFIATPMVLSHADASDPVVELHGDQLAQLPDALVTEGVPPVGRTRAGGTAPETWCGDATTTDTLVGARYPVTTPQLKLLYVHASDQANRFATLANRLQANVSVLGRYVAAQSGGRKALRWDMGTSCGAQYVDVQTVSLPQPRSYYVPNGAPSYNRVRDDVLAKVSSQTGPRNWVVYADGFYGTNGVAGTAAMYLESDPATDLHDRGRNVAAVFAPQDVSQLGATYAWPSVMFHEIAHNLGAVQLDAPHTTDNGHCNDRYDVMCYPDGGTRGQNANMTYPCPRLTGQAVDETLDCGGDDYFNPAPVPGSYLATHWNVFDSAHLGQCSDELSDMCGTAPSGDVTPPVNTTPAFGDGWRTAWSVTLSGTDAASPVTGFEWQVNAGAVQSSTVAAVPETSGVHQLKTRVGDAAGNWSAWRTESVRIDRVAPSVSLRCVGGAGEGSCGVEATDSGGSGVASTRWTLNGGAERELPIAVAGAGRHTIAAIVRDAAGNATTRSVTITVTDPGAVTATPATPEVSSTPARPLVASVPRSAATSPALGTAAALPRTSAVQLRRSGRTLATATLTAADGRVAVALKPRRLARGTWRLRACNAKRCVTRVVKVGASGRAATLTGSLPTGTIALSLERKVGGTYRFQARSTTLVS